MTLATKSTKPTKNVYRKSTDGEPRGLIGGLFHCSCFVDFVDFVALGNFVL